LLSVADEGRRTKAFDMFRKTESITKKYRKVNTMLNVIRQFIKEDEGLAAAEYAILLTLIAVALIAAVTAFRAAIQASFTAATTALS
jgi:pilus assembly protein Flp/PilA